VSLSLAHPPCSIVILFWRPHKYIILPRLCNMSYHLLRTVFSLWSCFAILTKTVHIFNFSPFLCTHFAHIETSFTFSYILNKFRSYHILCIFFTNPFPNFIWYSCISANHSLEFHHSLSVPYFKNQFLIGSYLDCFQFFIL
jgi:hypothetical protein